MATREYRISTPLPLAKMGCSQKFRLAMAQIEITIKNDQGKELTRLQSINLELGSQSLNDIEKAVEELKRKMLPEITKELLSKTQAEFTESKKKRIV